MGGDGTDVAKTLNHGGALADVHSHRVGGAVDEIRHAAPGGFATAERAAQADGFAGDNAGHGAAFVHGVSVHDPRHRLFVGAHVGCHHVHLRADERDHFLGEPAREPLDFTARHFAWIAGDA